MLPMQCILNGQEFSLKTEKDLRQCFEQIHQQQFSELWLTREDGGPSLTMLANGTSAWLMYLQEPGDSGFHSLNLAYHGPAERHVQFQLSNGQIGEYHVAWTLPLEEAFDACMYFMATTGGRSRNLTWEDA